MDTAPKAGAAPRRRAAASRLACAFLLALPSAGCPPADLCTTPPPRPPGAAVSEHEWNAAVHPNCFDNQLRIGRWFGRNVAIAPRQSPAQYYVPVGAGAIQGGSVVVLVHGWAPGFRPAVDNARGNLQWWQDGATDSSGVWASDWAWVPTTGTSTKIPVTTTGVFQEIVAHDPGAVVLGYSWIDDSATIDDSFLDLRFVYRSEAYTNVNGLRLAAALEQILAPSFWNGAGNRLHLIGHSHGSKVATVATLALQSRGRRVDHLTILDSPESESTLVVNGSNLLGYYLDQILTASGSGAGQTATFVDNYASYFGVAFTGSGNVERVVNVVLDPEIYSCTTAEGAGNRHAYAATWYAGGAAAAASFKLPPIGFDWPPPPTTSQPALNQQWSGGINAKSQWALTAGPPGSLGCLADALGCSYSAPTATVALGRTTGNVSGTPATGLVLSAGAGSGVVTSSFRARTNVSSSQYGIAFQVEWTSPTAGDYLVVTGSEAVIGTQEVLLVMDGKSAIAGRNPVSINAEVVSSLDFDVYYVPAATNHAGSVEISDFRRVEIGGDDCTELLARDQAAADDEQAGAGEPASAAP